MLAEIDPLARPELRKDQRRGEVKVNDLRHDHEEGKKAPMLMRPQSKERPPALHRDQHEQAYPHDQRPEDDDSIARLDDPPDPLQKLGDRQPEDDREKNREVTESAHRAPRITTRKRAAEQTSSPSRMRECRRVDQILPRMPRDGSRGEFKPLTFDQAALEAPRT